jgi:hypothetical protein
MASAKRKYKVLVLFDTAGTPPSKQDFTEEMKTDDWAAEAHIIAALNQLGHDVRTIGVYDEPGDKNLSPRHRVQFNGTLQCGIGT